MLQENTTKFKEYIMEVVAKEFARNIESTEKAFAHCDNCEPELDERLSSIKRDYRNTVAVLDNVFDYVSVYDEKFEELSRQNQEILKILKSIKAINIL